ncbi:hypothetical protein RFI_25309 [Reticulomyxa filosa]|uniref:Uncharacterized protein n=1 Tax=Reticulomyxa filosa TaxID=46433 RepID=X6MF74_RETFI|nr:hypothetical protein RFI_25309 [Reticulomyxa filosa]|eukprot:ETO12067.1 hypothetical protein RFI_25309 [Reticulomyxa filosa]
MATISNINFQYLLNKKTKRVTSWEENLIEKANIYKLSDEIHASPISVLIVPFLLQQLIWVLSGALSNAQSHVIKSVFGYTFAIIDICFIVAVLMELKYCDNTVNYFIGINKRYFYGHLKTNQQLASLKKQTQYGNTTRRTLSHFYRMIAKIFLFNFDKEFCYSRNEEEAKMMIMTVVMSFVVHYMIKSFVLGILKVITNFINSTDTSSVVGAEFNI